MTAAAEMRPGQRQRADNEDDVRMPAAADRQFPAAGTADSPGGK